MLISEVTGKTAEDIINEGDMLLSNLNAMILKIKDRLEQKQRVWNLEEIINELNRRSLDGAYLNPNNEEIKNWITKKFEENGLSIERGSGEVTMGAPEDVDTENPEEVEKKNKSTEIAGKAMDKIKNGGENNEIDGKL